MTKTGLFGIGLDTYWDQFDGLLERLKAYQKQIADKMESFGAEVVDAGLVDSPEKAKEAGDYLKKNDVDIVFLYVSTYALSSTVLPVVQKVKCPIIILNIQPVAAIDYEKFNNLGDRGKMTGEWLAHCQACSVPELIVQELAMSLSPVIWMSKPFGTIFKPGLRQPGWPLICVTIAWAF